MSEQYEESPGVDWNNSSHEDYFKMVASEPSRTKQALALVYEDHFSRIDYVHQILPPGVDEKAAIDLTLSRLDVVLDSDDDAKATVARKWKIYLRSLQDTEKAA